jgi:hypothetical protein
MSVGRLEYIQKQVGRIANAIGVPEEVLPTFGTSEQSGRPHIEVTGDLFHYVICESGRELERSTTASVDDLMYLVFRGATFDMAMLFETTHQTPGEDFRRQILNSQGKLLEHLNPEWAIRLGLEQHRE